MLKYNMDHINTLTNLEGYVIFEKLIPNNLIDNLLLRVDELYPVRASSHNHDYAEKQDIKKLKQVSVWWSQFVNEFDEVKEIQAIIDPIIKPNLNNGVFYASDMVIIEPHSEWINPHVDTPYRFKQYNFDERLLGIQCIVALNDLDNSNGATGLVPFSQKRNFAIDMCYNGYYDHYFKKNVIQNKLPKGSLLMYNCRVLHSSMPNPTDKPRVALLLNYVSGDIVDDLKNIDNIWKSNGK